VLKYSVCVEAVYHGKDFYKSIEELAAADIGNIEFWSWWDKDLDRILELKKKLNLTITTFCTKFFSLVNPAERSEYLAGFEESCKVAQKLGCTQLITKPLDKTGESFDVQYKAVTGTLKKALKIASSWGITILLEPVNSKFEAPNTFLDNSSLGFRIIDDINDPHLKLLYDIYHMQIDEGDILRHILPNIQKIGHFHTAGSTGRHELDDGELNYAYIFQKLDEAGYKGYTGLEYFPAHEALKGLKTVIGCTNGNK
jgi:hydroxypyruvate isomerase